MLLVPQMPTEGGGGWKWRGVGGERLELGMDGDKSAGGWPLEVIVGAGQWVFGEICLRDAQTASEESGLQGVDEWKENRCFQNWKFARIQAHGAFHACKVNEKKRKNQTTTNKRQS
jgi:hypothetical protein